MTKTDCKINLKEGLHARPASTLSKIATGFESKIIITHKGTDFEAKSILMLMSLGADKGDIVTITADGSDEKEATDKIKEFLTSDN